MKAVTFILAGLSIAQLSGANIDSQFGVDPDELQLREISENVRRVSGAVMGLAEYVMEIRNELKTIRSDILESRSELKKQNTTGRPHTYYSGRPIRDPEEVRKQSLELADKVERLLAMDQSPEVDLAKEELRRTVEKNFLRMLAAILVTGPAHTQERSDDIFKLMRSVLNGELDFTPVVQRLPLILRDSETNQFVNLLITLRESERGGGSSFRQGLFTSVENTDQVSGDGRQILPNFPIPNSPQLIGSFQNNNNFNNPPPFNNNYQNNPPTFNNNNFQNNPPPFVNNNQNNYRPNPGSLLQQANNNRNTNSNRLPSGNNRLPSGNNRLPSNNNRLPSNNNRLPQNTNNINNNNAATNNNGQEGENQNGDTQTQNPNGNQLPSINSLIDAMTQTQQLIKEIPSLVEGLQTLVESLEGLIG